MHTTHTHEHSCAIWHNATIIPFATNCCAGCPSFISHLVECAALSKVCEVRFASVRLLAQECCPLLLRAKSDPRASQHLRSAPQAVHAAHDCDVDSAQRAQSQQGGVRPDVGRASQVVTKIAHSASDEECEKGSVSFEVSVVSGGRPLQKEPFFEQISHTTEVLIIWREIGPAPSAPFQVALLGLSVFCCDCCMCVSVGPCQGRRSEFKVVKRSANGDW